MVVIKLSEIIKRGQSCSRGVDYATATEGFIRCTKELLPHLLEPGRNFRIVKVCRPTHVAWTPGGPVRNPPPVYRVIKLLYLGLTEYPETIIQEATLHSPAYTMPAFTTYTFRIMESIVESGVIAQDGDYCETRSVTFEELCDNGNVYFEDEKMSNANTYLSASHPVDANTSSISVGNRPNALGRLGNFTKGWGGAKSRKSRK